MLIDLTLKVSTTKKRVYICFQGDHGPLGLPGSDGLPALDGIPGLPGDNASIPIVFLRGVPGFPGSPGVKGARGEKGGRGETGESYPPPVINLKGDKGYKGTWGDVGEPTLNKETSLIQREKKPNQMNPLFL